MLTFLAMYKFVCWLCVLRDLFSLFDFRRNAYTGAV